VAATRAKERLILAGKQPRQKKDGACYQLPESWQKWFEEALGITEEDKKKGAWEDSANDLKSASSRMSARTVKRWRLLPS